MASLPEEPKINKYTVDPYSARALILKLELQYDLTIRVYDSTHNCMICIDKGDRKDDTV